MEFLFPALLSDVNIDSLLDSVSVAELLFKALFAYSLTDCLLSLSLSISCSAVISCFGLFREAFVYKQHFQNIGVIGRLLRFGAAFVVFT